MADEADLVLRLRMAIVGDAPGARRSAEKVAAAIDQVINEEMAKLEARAASGEISPQKLAAEVDELRAAVRAYGDILARETGSGVAAGLAAPGTTTRGAPYKQRTVEREVGRSFGLADFDAATRSIHTKYAQMVQGLAIAGGDPFGQVAEAADEMVNAARQRAAVLKILAKKEGDLAREYARLQASARSSQAQIDAAIQQRLATDTAYTGALAQSATAQAQIKAATQQQLALWPPYIASVAAAKVAQEQVNASVQQQLVNNTAYTNALAQGKILQQQINNTVLRRQLATGLAGIQAEAKALQAQLNVQVQRHLLTNTEYTNDLAEAKLLQEQINNRILTRQLTNGYVEAQAEGKALQEQLNARVRQRIASEGKLALAAADRAIADRRIKGQTDQEVVRQLQDPVGAAAFQQDTRAQAQRRALEAQLTLADKKYIQHQAETAAAKKLEAAQSKQKQLVDANYIEAVTVEAAVALESAALKQKAALAALSSRAGAAQAAETAETQGVLAARQRVTAEFQRVAELRHLVGLTQMHSGVVAAEVQEALEGRGLADTYNKLLREKIALQARAVQMGLMESPSNQRQQGLGLAGSFRTTLRYGISGALLYGAAGGVAASVREAAELEKIFNQVERQFQSLDRAAEFPQFKKAVFDIAELTGQAADDVAKVGFQLQGAFGGDTLRAINETRSAIIAARITGLELTEVIDAFTAITQNFADSNMTIDRFSDTAVQLQENLGVLAKETVSFSADLAPVAAELGFTADQLATLGAVAQKYSGRSGASLAEAYGRILPQIREQGVAIVEIFSSLEDVGLVSTLNEAFAAGDIEQAFNAIIGNYNRLGAAQQGAVIDLLGGRREAQAIIPILQNGQAVIAEYGKTVDAEGKSIEYFNDLQETLQQRLAVLSQEFAHLVQQLYEAGMKDFFADFVDLLASTVRLLSLVTRSMESFIDVLGPLPELLSPLLQGALIFRGLQAGARGLSKVRGGGGGGQATGGGLSPGSFLLGGLFGRRGRRQAEQAGASVGDAVAVGAASKIPTAFGVGAAIVASVYSGIDNANRRAVERAVNEFTVGGVTEGEADRLLNRFGVEGGQREVLARLRSGDTEAEVAEELGNLAERTASSFQQALDILPGEMSRKIAIDQAKIDAMVNQVAGEMEERIASGLERYNVDESFQQDVDARAAYLVERMLKRPLKQFEELDIGEAALSFLRDEVGQYNDDDASLGEVRKTLQDRFASMGFEFEGVALAARDALDEMIAALGSNVEAGAVLDEGAIDEVEGIIDRVGEATRLNKLPELLSELQSEMPEMTNLGKQFVGRLGAIFEQAEQDAAQIVAQIEEAQLGLEGALAGFEAGTVGSRDVADAFQRQIAILRAQASGNPDIQVDLANAIQDARDFQFQLLEDEVNALTGLGEVTGATDFERINNMYTAALQTGNFSISQRADIVRALVANRRANQQHMADQLEDEAAREAALAADLTLTDVERGALAAEQLISNNVLRDAITRFAEGNEQEVQRMIQAIVDHAYQNGVAVSESTRSVLLAELNAEREMLRVRRTMEVIRLSVFSAFERAASRLGAAVGAAAQDFDFTGLNEATIRAYEDAELYAREQEIEAAATELEGVTSPTAIPTTIPGVGTSDAKDEMEERKKALEEAFQLYRETEEALLDLMLARVEGDPVAEARVGIQQAESAMKFARTEAERLSAEATRIRADRQLQQAIYEVSNSQVELLIAQAEAAGNSVEAARLGVQRIKDQIAQAQALGVGDAEINNLRGELAAAERAESDAVLSDRREYFQYLSDVGKITQGQLIGYLQTLQAIPTLTEKQRRDLEVEIYNLRQQLGQDFQFNLPTDLGLPTAYEVRRFNQSSSDGMPGGYNDNRVITVQVNAQTNADAQQIANAVAAAVGEPNRNGTYVRRY